jgi:Glycosyl hydrolases family 16
MFDDFTHSLNPHWTQTCVGGGGLRVVESALRMEFPSAQSGQYVDAQIDDYAGRVRSAFPWKPPLRMEVRARSSLPAASASSTDESTAILRGTAGFGFWNYPFTISGDILFLPEAIWFFYASPPSNMALVPGVPGWGWKAQVVHSLRFGALAAAVPTALTVAWSRLTDKTQQAERWLQKLSGAQEALIAAEMDSWHTYVLEWQHSEARFWVDGAPVLTVQKPPARPLGFVAWLDNQYAIATPRGTLRFGSISCGPQWFEIDSIKIERC